MEVLKIRTIDYVEEKDILYLGIIPGVETVTTVFGDIFLMWKNGEREQLAGIEIMDFEAEILPKIYQGQFQDLPTAFFQLESQPQLQGRLREILLWIAELNLHRK